MEIGTDKNQTGIYAISAHNQLCVSCSARTLIMKLELRQARSSSILVASSQALDAERLLE